MQTAVQQEFLKYLFKLNQPLAASFCVTRAGKLALDFQITSTFGQLTLHPRHQC